MNPVSRKLKVLFLMGMVGIALIAVFMMQLEIRAFNSKNSTTSLHRQGTNQERNAQRKNGSVFEKQEIDKLRTSGEYTPNRSQLIALLGKKGYTVSDDIEIYHLMLAEAKVDPSWTFHAVVKNREGVMFGYYKDVLKEIYRVDPQVFFDCLSEPALTETLRVSPKLLSGACGILADNLTDGRSISEINRLYKEFNKIDDGYLRILAATDLEKAIELVSQLEVDPAEKLKMKGSIASTLALDGQPQEALEMIRDDLSVRISPSHDQALYHIFAKTSDGITSVLNSASSESLIHIAASPDLVKLIAERGSNSDKELLLSKTPFTEAFVGSFNTILSSTFLSTPETGMRLIDDLPKGTARDRILAGSFETLAGVDDERAIQLLSTLPQADLGIATRSVVKMLAVTDYEKSLQLARQTDESLQQDAYREIARACAYQTPENAVRMLEDNTISAKLGGPFRSEMLNNTVQTWAKKDLSAARIWVESLAPLDAPKGYQGLMTPWMKSDPVAASEWLSKQPSGPARDAGAAVIIQQIKNTDPQMAEQWRKSQMSHASGKN